MSLAPIDYYDAKVWEIDEVRPLLQREDKAVAIINRYSPKNKRISLVDIGCGDGQFLEALNKANKKIKLLGLDYSKYKLKMAKSKHPFDFKWCNLEVGIPLKDESVSIVYSGEVIEHIYNPDFMLEEAHRVLEKDGLLVISTPNIQAWYNRVLFLFGIQPLFYETSARSALIGAGVLKKIKKGTVPVGHLRVFNKTAIIDLAVASGFEVIQVKGAIFQSLPKPVQFIDNIFNTRPSLASNLILVARKK